MDTEILKEFLCFLNKSAVLGGQSEQMQSSSVISGTNPPRQGMVDNVNISMSPDINHSSYGAPTGVPKPAAPINFKKQI
jgi:hypothetical protein